jgi:ABC-type transporter Mla MlaB component
VSARGRRPADGPPPGRPAIILVPSAPSTHAQVEALCEHIRQVIEGRGSDPVVCDVAEVADPDAGTVEALARLQLTAVRLGRRVKLVNACFDLQGLLALTGLGEVLPCDEPCAPSLDEVSGVEPLGKPEQREQALGVQEERDPRDPPI